MRLAMTFPAQHDAIKQRRIRSAPMMKFERVPSAAPLTAIDSAPQCRLADDYRELAAGASVHVISRSVLGFIIEARAAVPETLRWRDPTSPTLPV